MAELWQDDARGPEQADRQQRVSAGISGLFKQFGENIAVDHIDFRVPAGSFFGLVDPNGAGKTVAAQERAGASPWP